MKNFNNIFEPTSCLSEETLQAYAAGKLSPEEKHHAEKHMADCPMCADAAEGLGYMKHPEKLTTYVNAINAEIDARIRPKQKPFIFRIKPAYSIAAAVILLIGITYFLNISFFNLKHDHAVAEQFTEEINTADNQMVPVPPPVDEAFVETQEKESDSKTQKDIPEHSEKHETEVAQEAETKITDTKNEDSGTGDDEVFASEALPETDPEQELSKENVSESENEEAEAALNDLQNRLKQDAREKEKTDKGKTEKDKFLFGKTRSSSETDDHPAEDPEEGNATYEQAVKFYKAEAFDKAAEIFDRLRAEKNNPHQFDAAWFRALIYKARDKKAQARELFKEVARSDSKFSEKAKQELQ